MTDKKTIHSNLSGSRDHMANERTFLAWVRTSIGVIAFGIVIERLAFVGSRQPTSSEKSFHLAGVALVALGVLMAAFAFIRFRTVEKELDDGTYKPSQLLSTVLAFILIPLGIFLIWVLIM
jgi:putative membrane protein